MLEVLKVKNGCAMPFSVSVRKRHSQKRREERKKKDG